MQENSKTPTPVMLGSNFMSRVREINPKAKKMNLREILAFPDNRDRPPEIAASGIDYPSMVTGGPIAKIDSKWYGKPVASIGAGAAGWGKAVNPDIIQGTSFASSVSPWR